MLAYIAKRVIMIVPLMVLISIVTFVLIQLPPGDYLTSYAMRLAQTGETVDEAVLEGLRQRYGLDQPMHIQYFRWVKGMFKGDFGYSFEWDRPVSELIWGRLGLTLLVSLCTLTFMWIVSFVIGIYSATHQYSLVDYVFTVLGFLGLAIPNFLFALVLMWISFAYFGINVGGLFSPEYVDASWSFAKLLNLLKHLWIPVIVIGTSGTASLIRTLRANLLDELSKPYVITAEAKGLRPFQLILKYPVRIAIIPFISTVGWTLPTLISGDAITSVVLNIPTTGPLLLRALQSQDMYLAGSFLLLLSFLTVIGTLISDILLAWADPRIRL